MKPVLRNCICSIVVILGVCFFGYHLNAQTAPSITYGVGSQSFIIGSPISVLAPTNSGGAVSPVSLQVTTFGSGLNSADGIAFDTSGNLIVADRGNRVIKKITPAGVVTIIAGSGGNGVTDNINPLLATFQSTYGIAVDGNNNIYVTEFSGRLRKISYSASGYGAVTTLVFTSIGQAWGVAADATGANIYIASNGTQNWYRYNTITPSLTNFLSIGNVYPIGATLSSSGNLYISSNNGIQKAALGGGSAASPLVNSVGYIRGMGFDASGNLFYGDILNQIIGKIAPDGTVSNYAGISGSGGSQNGVATSAKFNNPNGIAVDKSGNVYVADEGNNVIRKIAYSSYSISPSLPAGLSLDPFTGNISGTPTTTSPSTVYTITAYNATGSSSTTVTIAVSVAPIISKTGTLTALSSIQGSPSAVNTSFSISGSNMQAGILVSAPTGFEVSTTSGSGYANSITVGTSGTIAATTVYLRLAASNSPGTYSGNIVLSSTGATSINAPTVSSNTYAPAPVISSISPLSGDPASVVTITGSNFNSTAANNIVFLGGVLATVNSATTTSLSVTVPSGASYQAVSVTNNFSGFTGYSKSSFLPSFDNTGLCINTVNLSSKIDFTAGTNPQGLAIGDLDGDGKPDIAFVNKGSNTISILRNISASGSITSGSFAAKIDFATNSQPIGIAIGDLDGDGKPEIVVANSNNFNISVYKNTTSIGSITAASFAAKLDIATNQAPHELAIMDIDGDGKPEILVTNDNANNVSVFQNKSSVGTLSFGSNLFFTTGTNPEGIAVADIDGDGKPDLVVANGASGAGNTVSVYRNTSTSGTISSASFASPFTLTTGSYPFYVSLSDMDGDGKPDLIVSNVVSGTLSVFRNKAVSGTLTSASFDPRVDFTTASNPGKIVIGDMNGDGKPDMVIGNYNAASVSVFRNTSSSGVINSNTFAPKSDFTAGTNPWGVGVADMDGDGKPDVIVSNLNSNTVSVFRNNPIAAGTIGFVNSSPQALALCQNAAPVSLNSFFTVSDNLAGETLNYTVVSGPTHGTLNGFPASKVSVSGNVLLTGISYTAVNGYSGSDVIIVQVSNCLNTITTTINITVNPLPTIVPVASATVVCQGTPVTLSGSGASAHTWSGGVSDGISFILSETTTYTVSGTDANGCINTASQTITVNSLPIVIVASTDVSCAGSKDGSITLTATNGNLYSIDGGISYQTGNVFTGLAEGNYSIAAKSLAGCISSIQNISIATIPDITAPVADIASLPVITGECSVAVTAPTATDNCAGTITGTTTDPLTYNAQGTYTITWTYDDGQNNIATQIQTVIVKDITAPVADIASLPVIMGECSAAVTAPTATDNCAGTITGTTTDPLTYNAQGTYTITWTYDDGHNNIATQIQTVIVKDITAPVADIASLPVITGECSAAVTAPTATDNCAGTITGTTTDPLTYNTQGTYTITWTYDDGHHNTSTQTQTVIVKDVTPPAITCSENVNVLATSAAGAVVTYKTPVATDNCSGVTIALTSGLPSGSTFPTGITTVTYRATDVSGNSVSCSFDVTVSGLAPVINCPASINTNATEGQCGANVMFTATETTGIPASTLTYSIQPGSFFSVGITTVVATASNPVGSVSCTFSVTVTDTEKPLITQPSNITVNNDAGTCGAAVKLTTPSVTDNCSVLSITSDAPSTFAKGVTLVTWTAKDIHNNSSTITQTVTVKDAEAPTVFNCQGSTHIADANVCTWTGGGGTFTIKDNCTGNLFLTEQYFDKNGNKFLPDLNFVNSQNSFTLGSRTYPIGKNTVVLTVRDSAGNVSQSCSFTVTVTDAQKPVITQPSNVIVNNDAGTCGAVVKLTTPAVTDNCGVLSIVSNAPATFPLGLTIVTWTAIDVNGNSSSITQTVTVKDTEAPIITCAPTVTINTTLGQCTGTTTLTAPTVIDNCGDGGNALSFDGINDYVVGAAGVVPTSGEYTVALWAKQVNNHTGEFREVFAQGRNLYFGQSNTGIIRIGDNWQNTGVPFPTDNQWHHYAIVRTTTNAFLYIDGVLKATRGRAIGSPVAVAPFDNNLVIGAQFTRANELFDGMVDEFQVWNTALPATQILANMNTQAGPQSGLVAVYHFNQGIAGGNNAGLTSLTDGSGNGYNGTLNNFTLNGSSSNWVSGKVLGATVGNNAPATYPVGNTTVTWTATDASGNSATCNQVVTVIDNQFPVLVGVPANTTIGCDAIPAAAIVTATDNCAAPPVMYTEKRTDGDCSGRYTLTRTWSTTDASNNTTTASQVITVQDTKAPILTDAPADMTVECDAVPTAEVLTATDNCSTPTVSYTEVRTDGNCLSNYILTRTWTAVDACGNTSSKTQVITVQDTKAPILTDAPEDMTVECDAVPIAEVLTATDNCSTPIVTYVETRTNGSSVNNYTLTRTWTATDPCGNANSKTQVIAVKDTQAPIITFTPANIAVNTNNNVCGAVVSFAAKATDVCGPVVITYSQNPGTVFAVGTTVVKVTATDPSGNQSTSSFTVKVTDLQKPNAITQNITVYLDQTGKVSITAAQVNNGSNDACGIASLSVLPSMFDCSKQGANTVTLTVKDVNGNASIATAVVTVLDKLGPLPTVATLPTISAQCSIQVAVVPNNWWWYGDDGDDNDGNYYYMQAPTAMDNCSGLITGTTSDPLKFYTQGTYTINWKFVDSKGNVTMQPQTVIVKDNIAPKPWLTILPTISGQCSVSEGSYDNDWRDDDDDDDYGIAAPWAWDNCAGWIRATTADPLSYNSQGTYTIHWKFDDGHGNITIQNQAVIVKDVIAPKPVVSSLPTITGQCSVTITSKPTANDNCAGVIGGTTLDAISYTTQGTYIIHWTYNDGNGNSITQNQTVIVKDNTKPVISDVADLTVNCGASTDPSATGIPTATDNCGSVTLSKTDVTNGNVITRTWKATDGVGNYSTSTQVITVGAALNATVSSIPTSNVYTGGVNTNLYLGYGAQSSVLQSGSLPSNGAPYSYAWTGTNTTCLTSITTASPVFTPTAAGYYTFTVTVTNKYNCKSTASISICVTDVRVTVTGGSKINICHNGQTLQVSVSAASAHIGNHNSDKLGSCDQITCAPVVSTSNTSIITSITKQAETSIATTEEELKVTVMPNPSSTYFTLKLESKYETPISMRVMDGRGRVVDAKSRIGANSTMQIGHNYSSGTYYVELIQGTQRKVVQLIKAKE